MVYPALLPLLPLMRTSRLPAVDWTDTPADLNGFVRFTERLNLVSAHVPSRFKRALPSVPGYLRKKEEHKPDPWRKPIERNHMGLHLENEVYRVWQGVKTPTIIPNNPVLFSKKVQAKLSLSIPWRHVGKLDVYLQSFLILVIQNWLATFRLLPLYPRKKKTATHWIRGSVSLRANVVDSNLGSTSP